MQICFQTTKKSISKYREKNAIEMTGYKEIEIQDKLVYGKNILLEINFFNEIPSMLRNELYFRLM